MSTPTSLGQAPLWTELKDFYGREGVAAWDQQVPFYATSNPYLADAYAAILWRFMEETLALGLATAAEPFYMLELGAGAGILGFYLCKRLSELQAAARHLDIRYCYVMSDCSAANLDFWRTHPALQPYVEAGQLDFAQFDVLEDQAFTLVHSDQRFATASAMGEGPQRQNPLLVVANYLFDTLPHDLFQVADGQLQEGVGHFAFDQTQSGQHQSQNQAVSLAQLDPTFHYRELDLPYYETADLDALLTTYAASYGKGYFSLPIGGLHALQTLRQLANDKLLFLTSDKGRAKHARRYRHTPPAVVFHGGALSLTVNFEAVGAYMAQLGGDHYQQSTQQRMTTGAFVMGWRFDDLPHTTAALQRHLDTAGPGHLFALYKHVQATHQACTLDSLLSYLQLLQWDPHLFNQVLPTIISQLHEPGNGVAIQDLVDHLPELAANGYALPWSHARGQDILFNIGLLLQALNHYEAALDAYAASLACFGHAADTLYHIGLCHAALGDQAAADQALAAAAALDPHGLPSATATLVQTSSTQPPARTFMQLASAAIPPGVRGLAVAPPAYGISLLDRGTQPAHS